MTKERYEKLLPNYGESTKGLKDLAIYVVDHDCTDIDGKPMVGEQRMDMIKDMAYNMEIGSNFSRGKFIFSGIVVGVAVTLGISKIIKHFRKES